VRPDQTAPGATKLLPQLDELTPSAIGDQIARHAATVEEEDGRGPAGNSRLTAMTGVILLVLVAIEGLTLVSLRPLLPAHVFVGMLLIPPIALKLASTGYRFARYYTKDRAYILAGPPQLLMRALGPFVIVATLVLFGSGVAMLAIGPGQGWVVNLHKASFIAWLVVTGIHVLGHIVHIPGLAAADFRAPRARRAGSRLRQGAVVAALVAGLVLAIATLQYAAPWQAVTG
jgi:hypothetical protein